MIIKRKLHNITEKSFLNIHYKENVATCQRKSTNKQTKYRITGWSSFQLSQRGKDQAFVLKHYFEKIAVEVVYTSPLQRAIETAETAFPGLTPIIEPLIDNLNLGEWSGKDKKMVFARHCHGMVLNFFYKFKLDYKFIVNFFDNKNHVK